MITTITNVELEALRDILSRAITDWRMGTLTGASPREMSIRAGVILAAGEAIVHRVRAQDALDMHDADTYELEMGVVFNRMRSIKNGTEVLEDLDS